MNKTNNQTIPVRNIWDYWPTPEHVPRETQKTVLNWLAELPADKKYIFCQIPVGGGKSHIGLTYAGYLGHGNLGSSYILTPQRILQRQYEDTFKQNLVSVYGKSNYMCNTKIGLDCDVGNDIKPKCTNCPAKAAFGKIPSTPHVVLNYKLAMLYSELFPYEMDDFPVKDLMIFDECHTLENHLVNHRAVRISERKCDRIKIKYRKPKNLKEAQDWLREKYLPALNELYSELAKSVKEIDNKYEFSQGSLLPSEFKTKKEYKETERHRKLVLSIVNLDYESLDKHYVIVNENKNFQFKEIYGANLFRNILESKANRFLFMSSTILNFDAFASDLGIPTEQIAKISLRSEFDEDNRPIYFMPTAKMAYGWDKPEKTESRQKMANKVIDLCQIHAEDSGIVHTGSFKIAKWLIGEIKDKIPHRIITHGNDDSAPRDECIQEFTENEGKEPLILISPSITEGLDLTDNTGRFAMFVKVPYPSLADEWVKKRLDLSDEWYQRQAFTSIIQGSGRIVRSDTDWGNTYILDESFNYLWFKFKRLTPEWWKDALVKVK